MTDPAMNTPEKDKRTNYWIAKTIEERNDWLVQNRAKWLHGELAELIKIELDKKDAQIAALEDKLSFFQAENEAMREGEFNPAQVLIELREAEHYAALLAYAEVREALEPLANAGWEMKNCEHVTRFNGVPVLCCRSIDTDLDTVQKARKALAKPSPDLKKIEVMRAFLSIRESVRWFAEQMELKLRENDHKGGWRECDYLWLLKRCKEEHVELATCVGALDAGNKNVADLVVKEAADVANFAMMIADLAALDRLKEQG